MLKLHLLRHGVQMVKQLNKELEDVIEYIKSSDSYKKCLELKTKMNSNHELVKIVEEVKNLQKKYVRSNYQDIDVKIKLDELNDKLYAIPLYVDYMNNLEDVNNMINLVRDSLNDYFYKVLNEK